MAKYNYQLNSLNRIVGITSFPYFENKPNIEIETLPKNIFDYKIIDGILILDENIEAKKNQLRNKRDILFKKYIDRSRLWYNSLTNEQYTELTNWYNAWLNVTKTLVEAEMPSWLK